MNRPNYESLFRQILEGVPETRRLPFRAILEISDLQEVSEQTVKRNFKAFIDDNPNYLWRVTGLYPNPETIIHLVEQKIGPIIESNLDDANLQSSHIVQSIGRFIVEEFIRDGLSENVGSDNDTVHIDLVKLSDFLMGNFAKFLRSTQNGLISIAGGLNELLLIRAMVNARMTSDDFIRTGKNSKADIVVHCHKGSKDNLSVEVKSYHARERLLRGLQDIGTPKVGVGFFKDPSEFNPDRTKTLLQARPAAIYLPQVTLDELSNTSRDIKTTESAAYGSSLYRPLERFVTDMKWFNAEGELARYP
jgi:hypothetical protein